MNESALEPPDESRPSDVPREAATFLPSEKATSGSEPMGDSAALNPDGRIVPAEQRDTLAKRESAQQAPQRFEGDHDPATPIGAQVDAEQIDAMPKSTDPSTGQVDLGPAEEEPTPEQGGGSRPKIESQQRKEVAESANPEAEPAAARAGEIRPQDPRDADDVLTARMPSDSHDPGTAAADALVLAASRRRTRRSFIIGGAAAAGAYSFYHWLDYGPHRDMLPTLVDRTYETNAAVSRAVLRDHALAPTYPVSRAETLRVNGIFGLKKTLKLDTWRLQVVGVRDDARHPRYVRDVTTWNYEYEGDSHDDAGHDTKTDPSKQSSIKMSPAPMLAKTQADENSGDNKKLSQQDQQDANHTGRKPRGLEESGESDSTLNPGTAGLLLSLHDFVPLLPRHEFVTQFKCIEGWSQIVHWAGVRFADFLELFPPALVNGREPRYVYMETPDGDYYVGYDLHICRHPQTLLVTEMMGAPLTQSHGAPLRLHTPTKYGYKQIKRIGLIAYTDDKPDDYWTKLGYDWYAGL